MCGICGTYRIGNRATSVGHACWSLMTTPEMPANLNEATAGPPCGGVNSNRKRRAFIALRRNSSGSGVKRVWGLESASDQTSYACAGASSQRTRLPTPDAMTFVST